MRGNSAARISSLVVSFLLLITPAAAFAGSKTYATPGTYTFTVPDYTGTLSVTVNGAGGGGGDDDWQASPGGQSSFNGNVISYGGQGSGSSDGTERPRGEPGTASGGNVSNTTGGGAAGGAGTPGWYPGGNGGRAVSSYTERALPASVTVVVGSGGAGASGGAGGSNGSVVISWTDAPPPPPSSAPTCGATTNPTTKNTGTSGTQVFTSTGADQTFIVPAGITSINVQLKGAGGGTGCHYYGSSPSSPGSPGGSGGSTQGTLSVTPGQKLTVIAGGAGSAIACSDAGSPNRAAGGYGGGGKAQNGGSGGGRSAIQLNGTEIMTAGGGGGGGATGLVNGHWWCTTGGGPGDCPGGKGGGIGGANGTVAGTSYPTTGNGGTQTGPGICPTDSSISGVGHNGGNTYFSGGGGGGGWRGGSGSCHYGVGGGGGGSGHCDQNISSCTTTQGGGAASDTDGTVRVSWTSSGQTLSLCSAGYTLKNGQCVSADCPVCPAGQVLNVNNQCVTDTTCPTGYHWDEITQRCVLDDPITCPGGATLVDNVCTCPAGTHWDTAQNMCVPDNQCPAGQRWNGTQCVADNCPAGQHWNGVRCVPDNACPAGQSWNGSACICPAGTIWYQNQCRVGLCLPGLECGADGNVYRRDLQCNPSLFEECEWGCTNAVCNPPPQPKIITWKVSPTLVKKDDTTGVFWNVLNVIGCTVSGTNGDLWSVIKGSEVSSPIVARTTYTLHCTPYKGATWTDRTAIVNIIPVFKEQ